ncbi:thiamine diphosphokinase [Sphingobacterium sp. lm-10]|uniref:thiamine diphosphokinase n=1 Tax=Sphingobacterium sp. lm-10 TaxID=2944904 RepID=UPI00202247AE|nr:thiamine diphosphokinase [Sphingobacterium sp. lm-10]MCL7988269.1 thiamine diphosphokinase [Sphingobacterium sp. lm-10]
MSSHHIVRENQEPALLIMDVDAISEDSLGQLLEWSPIVVTIDANVDFLLSRGIKIDVVFTSELDFVIHQDGTLVLPIQQHVLLDALEYLKQKKQFALHILWNEFPADALLEHSQAFTFAVYSRHFKYVIRSSFHKWMPQESVMKVIAIISDYATENLKSVSDGKYRAIADGFVNIHSRSGNVLIIGEAL